MVNNIDTRYVTPKTAATTRKDGPSEVETHTDERRAAAKTLPVVERRKGRDRRNRRDKDGRLIYDMRSGRGRRKSDHIPPSIELDV